MTILAALGRGRAAGLIAAPLALILALILAPAAHAQLGQLTAEGKAAILARPATPFAGAATGDVTVVEYLDFNCPYCRKAAVTLAQLTAADPRVRVLYKDFPIFGGVSIYAARAALAAQWQGRYIAAHNILIDSPSRLASETQVRDRLAAAGVDLAQLDRDLETHAGAIESILARNTQEARALEFTGTPGLVIGDFVVPGLVDLENLRVLVNASRHREPEATTRKS